MVEIKNYMKPWISKLKPYLPGLTIEGFIKLASNENNYGPSPHVVKALNENSGKIFMYPYKDLKVEEAISKYCGVNPENIAVGNGSDELIFQLLTIFNGPAAGFTPSFSQYKLYSKILGIEYQEVKLEDGFLFSPKKFLKETEKANILFLCSPNNPTGLTLEPEDITTVLEAGKPTVVDEAYFEFCKKTSANLLPKYPNLIILRTFAKAFALAGLRVGYMMADQAVIKSVKQVKAPFNVNLLAQEAVLAAIQDTDYMTECVSKIIEDREKIIKKLSEKFKTYDSGGNFIFMDTSPSTSDEVYQKFLDEQIVVRNFGKFPGFSGEYVRITVGRKDENQKLLKVIDKL